MTIPDSWWQFAIEKSPHPTACITLDHKFKWANTSWLKMLGYSLSELRQKLWPDITLAADVGGDLSSIQRLIEDEIDEFYVDKTYICKDGKRLPVSIYVHRYPEHGPVEMFVVFAEPKNMLIAENIKKLKESYENLAEDLRQIKEESVAKKLLAEMRGYWIMIGPILTGIGWLAYQILKLFLTR